MPTRWVLHPERLDDVDGEQLMRRLGEEVAADMRRLVPKDKRVLVSGIELAHVSSDRARIVSVRPGGGGGSGAGQAQYSEEVPYFVEFGTSDTPARPYMRPAVYKRR